MRARMIRYRPLHAGAIDSLPAIVCGRDRFVTGHRMRPRMIRCRKSYADANDNKSVIVCRCERFAAIALGSNSTLNEIATRYSISPTVHNALINFAHSQLLPPFTTTFFNHPPFTTTFLCHSTIHNRLVLPLGNSQPPCSATRPFTTAFLCHPAIHNPAITPLFAFRG